MGLETGPGVHHTVAEVAAQVAAKGRPNEQRRRIDEPLLDACRRHARQGRDKPLRFRGESEGGCEERLQGQRDQEYRARAVPKPPSLGDMKSILKDNGMRHLELDFLTDCFFEGNRKAESDSRKRRRLAHQGGRPLQRALGARARCRSLRPALLKRCGARREDSLRVHGLFHDQQPRGSLPGSPLRDPSRARRCCGEGDFDIKGLIAGLRVMGHAGPWAVEVFSEELAVPPLQTVCDRACETTMAEFEG